MDLDLLARRRRPLWEWVSAPGSARRGEARVPLGFAGLLLLPFSVRFDGQEARRFLGLEPRLVGLQEAYTDPSLFPRATGELRAVMLFARFPDAETEETTQELCDLLVPGAQEYYDHASYGRLTFTVGSLNRWIPMDAASTSSDYDCSRFETHKGYIGEAMRKADGDADSSRYDIVYAVGSRSPGVHNSPTLFAEPGDGIAINGAEIRHAVTFGNDVWNEHSGWRVLIHETSHVLGLPDLYGYATSSVHEYVGGWDPMGLLTNGSDYLPWHKRKLGWLDEDQTQVVTAGDATVLLTPMERTGGMKPLVLPVSDEDAYAVEVRSREPSEGDETGDPLYRVNTATESGQGPMRVIPARADDDDLGLRRLLGRHWNALFTEGLVLDDPERYARIEILEHQFEGYTLRARTT